MHGLPCSIADGHALPCRSAAVVLVDKQGSGQLHLASGWMVDASSGGSPDAGTFVAARLCMIPYSIQSSLDSRSEGKPASPTIRRRSAISSSVFSARDLRRRGAGGREGRKKTEKKDATLLDTVPHHRQTRQGKTTHLGIPQHQTISAGLARGPSSDQLR